MVEKIEQKKSIYDPKNGVTMYWDNSGNALIAMPVNNIPRKQFENWITQCKYDYSGKRWDMIMAEHLKAQAYDSLMASVPREEREEEPEDKNINPLGLLNPEIKKGGTD